MRRGCLRVRAERARRQKLGGRMAEMAAAGLRQKEQMLAAAAQEAAKARGRAARAKERLAAVEAETSELEFELEPLPARVRLEKAARVVEQAEADVAVLSEAASPEIGRAHARTPATGEPRMPASA